ncbi:hypothetical protein QOZ80_3AG0215780 [Eleusine coracana subsp. coracana]|nr:hypothetical protein QOZ80_3AG0215780 [Eleusine coracana subsp. coracana]
MGGVAVLMEKGEDVSVPAHWDVVSEGEEGERYGACPSRCAEAQPAFAPTSASQSAAAKLWLGTQLTKTMMNVNRQFLNLVVKDNFIRTGVCSLRRIKAADHLFYPSTSAAETAMAQTAAAIKANAEFQAGYKDGMRSLKAMATSLGPLPPATINFQPTGRRAYEATLPLISLYVLTRRRTYPPELNQYAFEELSYGGRDMFASYEGMIHEWTPLPPPPFMFTHYPSEDDIGAYTVVDGSIYVSSSTKRGFGTYYFDTEHWKWWRAGKWLLPFSGKAEYVPELDLWFGLSSSHPFHLCASDLSSMDCQRPPTVAHSWVDLDMPKKWSPHRMDLIDLGSGRFCIVKFFNGTSPPITMGFSGDEGEDDGLLYDATDWIN